MEDSLEEWLKAKSPAEDSMAACKTGDVVGDWKILALLGKGGSAEVYRAEHVRSHQIGALKLLCRQEGNSRKRFLQECDLLRMQQLSCFARYFDAGEKDGRLFLVTEELHSFELPHKDPQVTQFILEVCKAVSVLHAEGYVHRDIKPGNIMRREDGSYVLIDLGLVKKMSNGDCPQFESEQLSIVDGQRVCVGTPGFSAPEQFVSGKATEASDIHAIAMLVNACFDGKPPVNWLRLIERATSSINSRRYQSIKGMVYAIRASSNIRPRLALLAELFSALLLAMVGGTYPFLIVGMAIGSISYDSLSENVFVLLIWGAIVAWLALIEFGIRKRNNWARRYIIMMGIIWLISIPCLGFNGDVGRSFWLGAIVFAVSRIMSAVLFLVPNVRSWFKATVR